MSHDPGNMLLLHAVYVAFNLRDINAALSMMTLDVAWPRAFKGGFVRGPDAVRAYWTEQWGEIDAHVEPVAFYAEAPGQVLVEVHQLVRGLDGASLADEIVRHRFTMADGLIQKMEVETPPAEAPSKRTKPMCCNRKRDRVG